MRTARLILVGVVALGLAPGTFVRSPAKEHDFTSPVRVTKLAVQEQSVGEMTLEAAWLLESENDLHGGWSAMVEWLDDSFLIGSDSGRIMVIERPDRSSVPPRLGVLSGDLGTEKRENDLESLSRDTRTNELWAGFERSNSIVRIARPLRAVQTLRPSEMAHWPANAGPESLVRLDDGRFIVIAETAVAPAHHEALLFPATPAGPGKPLRFLIEGREDYSPSDATALPDGRLLIILRSVEWGFPPRFPVMLVTADPARIAEGEPLATREVARIADPLPSDNYEGITVTRERDGSMAVWLISDDNFARYQRTIMLKLRWDE